MRHRVPDPDPAPAYDPLLALSLALFLGLLLCMLAGSLWLLPPRDPRPELRYTIVRHLPDGTEEKDDVYAPNYC